MLMTFVVGLQMMFWRNFNDDTFVPAGVLTSLLIGALGMYCLLMAARHGIASRLTRWAYAIGLLMLGIGTLVFGIMVITLIAFFVIGHGLEGLTFLFSTASIANCKSDYGSIVLVTRLSVIPLAVGILLHRWAWHRHAE